MKTQINLSNQEDRIVNLNGRTLPKYLIENFRTHFNKK